LVDQAKKPEYKAKMFELVPAAGTTITNRALRENFRPAFPDEQISDDDYWLIRDSLIEDGAIQSGRGYGGTVRRVLLEKQSTEPQTVAAVAEAAAASLRAEADLYEPFHEAIQKGYTRTNGIRRFVSEITARQGRRLTGGKWTRPDITLLAMRTYTFSPGKRLEVITFEVKEGLDGAVEGVFETLAHSVFAHRTFLAVHWPGYEHTEEDDDRRIVQECERFGVGYIVFDDPADYDTYNIVVSARLKEPDPAEVDNFIRQQISAEKQEEVREWIR
jgi:hypothetical protein